MSQNRKLLRQNNVVLHSSQWLKLSWRKEAETEASEGPRQNSPAQLVSVRSYLLATLGYSLSFRPLRFNSPVCCASSKTFSKVRESDVGLCPPGLKLVAILKYISDTRGALRMRGDPNWPGRVSRLTFS